MARISGHVFECLQRHSDSKILLKIPAASRNLIAGHAKYLQGHYDDRMPQKTLTAARSSLRRLHHCVHMVQEHCCIHTACSSHLQLFSSRRGELSSLEDARKFVASLPLTQKECLEKAIAEIREENNEHKEGVTPPTWKQLRLCEQHK